MVAQLNGIVIPAVTVFDADDEIDAPAMESNFAAWSHSGVAGYMVLGSNGEFRLLDDDEALRVVEIAVASKGDKELIVGIGRESTTQTLRFLRSLEPWYADIDHVSVLTPHYFGTLMDGPALATHFTTVADASPLPVLLYVAPGFANGVTVPPSVVAALADHPNIVGMKDTSPAGMSDFMVAAGGRDDFQVIAGSVNNLMTCLALGGRAGVVSAANYFPAQCAKLVELWQSGDQAGAVDYYRRLQQLVKVTGGQRSIASLKAAMDAVGLRGGAPRRPVPALDEIAVAKLRAVIESGLDQLA